MKIGVHKPWLPCFYRIWPQAGRVPKLPFKKGKTDHPKEHCNFATSSRENRELPHKSFALPELFLVVLIRQSLRRGRATIPPFAHLVSHRTLGWVISNPAQMAVTERPTNSRATRATICPKTVSHFHDVGVIEQSVTCSPQNGFFLKVIHVIPFIILLSTSLSHPFPGTPIRPGASRPKTSASRCRYRAGKPAIAQKGNAEKREAFRSSMALGFDELVSCEQNAARASNRIAGVRC